VALSIGDLHDEGERLRAMTDEPAEDLPQMIDHWWWRPGWSVGRQFYTWHLTFERQADVLRLVHEYSAHLDLPGLDIIPDEWLHLTMQGIGFVGEVDEGDVEKIVAAAQERLSQLEPFDISLGPTVVDPEVVRLRVTPADLVARLRRELRAAIADVWGADHVPEDEAGFMPHVSLAYSNGVGPMEPILRAAAVATPAPASMAVTHADLILLNRDQQQYEWTTFAQVLLADTGERP
jgi:2'-5' RNA ligase